MEELQNNTNLMCQLFEKKPEARDYQSFKLLPRTQPLTKPNPVFETSLQKNNPNVKVSIIHNISCR